MLNNWMDLSTFNFFNMYVYASIRFSEFFRELNFFYSPENESKSSLR